MNSTNPLKNTRIEFHIIQSFPVTCLNRDDVGAPKTAIVGGSTRARVSSQCWKRQVRLAMRDYCVLGSRTKAIDTLIKNACLEVGATEEQAMLCAQKISQAFIASKKEKAKKKTLEDDVVEDKQEDNDTLLFISPNELHVLAEAFKNVGFEPELVIKQKDQTKQAAEIEKLLTIGAGRPNIDAVDIALFGRMVAKAPAMNVEAAASFSHAISTHKVSNEVEFFTALDDYPAEQGGASHMGSLEFNSATYYRYISLDLGQLSETLGGIKVDEAVSAFVKALFLAVPNARQSTQSGASPWEYAKVLVRKGQRLQVPFETAVRAKEGGFQQPSIDALNDYLVKKEKLAGSLFGKIADYTFGVDENFTIDDLMHELSQHIVEVSV